jgi:hypothetical protein
MASCVPAVDSEQDALAICRFVSFAKEFMLKAVVVEHRKPGEASVTSLSPSKQVNIERAKSKSPSHEISDDFL